MLTKRKLLQSQFALLATLPLIKRSSAEPIKDKQILILDTYIAGYNHYKCKSYLSKLSVNDPLLLKPEPENAHDDKAIEIFFKGCKLGYIPKVNNKALFNLLCDKENIIAQIKSIKEHDYKPIDIKVFLTINS